MAIITNELLERGKSSAGAWSRFQLRLLGVAWPPQHGWRQKIIGLEVPDGVAAAFIESRNKRLPKVKSAAMRNKTGQHELDAARALWGSEPPKRAWISLDGAAPSGHMHPVA